MAEGKKSFLLYTDIQSTVNYLTDQQAGKLFKHLLSYVNDENPTSDDPLINIAFEPIKQSLKRDLKKYEKIREKRSEAGKASAENRKQNQQKSTHVKREANEGQVSKPTKINSAKGQALQVPNFILQATTNPVQRHILSIIFNWYKVNKPAFPTYQHLAKAIGCSYSTAQRQTIILIEKGLLKRRLKNKENVKEIYYYFFGSGLKNEAEKARNDYNVNQLKYLWISADTNSNREFKPIHKEVYSLINLYGEVTQSEVRQHLYLEDHTRMVQRAIQHLVKTDYIISEKKREDHYTYTLNFTKTEPFKKTPDTANLESKNLRRMSKNKNSKIIAKATKYDGIVFRSRLEAQAYIYLKKKYHSVHYEPFCVDDWTPDFEIIEQIEFKEGCYDLSALVEVKPKPNFFKLFEYLPSIQQHSHNAIVCFCPEFEVWINHEGAIFSIPINEMEWKQAWNILKSSLQDG